MHADAHRPPPVNVTSVNVTPPEVDKTPAKIWRDGKSPALIDGEAAGPPTASKRPGSKQPGVFLGRDIRRGFARRGVPSDWSAAEPEPGPTGLMLVDWACDVTEAATSWLWAGRIPLGRLTLLAAHDPRDASLVAMDLAARIRSDRSAYQGGGLWQLPTGATAVPDAEGHAASGAEDESFDATEIEHAPEALTIGEDPSRLEETARICNGEEGAAPPHD